jgi:hypothetical protein
VRAKERKPKALSAHAWEMLYVINKRTIPERLYWVPRERREYVDTRVNPNGYVIVYGAATIGALRALEVRGYTYKPAGATTVHRYAYATTDAGRAALEAHLASVGT